VRCAISAVASPSAAALTSAAGARAYSTRAEEQVATSSAEQAVTPMNARLDSSAMSRAAFRGVVAELDLSALYERDEVLCDLSSNASRDRAPDGRIFMRNM
jgi:hypothetical protein